MRILHVMMLALCAFVSVTPRALLAAERRGRGEGGPGGGAPGARASVHAILVLASNNPGPSDPRLRAYEDNLRSSLRMASFRFVGEGSASVAGGGTARLSLPSGQGLDLSGESDGRVLVHFGGTDISVPRGRTVVCAGRAAGQHGEVYAVVVTVN